MERYITKKSVMKKLIMEKFNMKGFIMLNMIIIFSLLFSACSSVGSNGVQEGTQQDESVQQGENTLQVDTKPMEESSEDESSAINAKTIKVALYFPTEDNSALKMEEREIQVIDGAILKACVLALADGPTVKGLRKIIPEGTEIRGISIKDKVATVDFSREFLETNGLSEITTRLSLVNTLTGISGVDKVRFRVDGKDMIGPSGMPLGDMGPALLNDDGTPMAYETKTVTLYFSDTNAMYLEGEKRDIMVTEKDSIEELIVRELIKGPVSEDLWSTIPDGSELISASTKNGICTVDFSSEYVDNSPGGSTSEMMAVFSVVNTLTELEGVEKVQFLIEGKKREIYTHVIFDEPFSRDENFLNTTLKAE